MTFPRVPVRRVARILNGGTPPSGAAELWGGEVPFVAPPDLNGLDGAPLKSTARTITTDGIAHSGLAPAGSVLLSTRAPIGHIGRLVSAAAFNQGCRALVPSPGHDARFLAYALIAARADMDARGLGTTFLELSGSSLAQVQIPVAAQAVQRAIADYLDRETEQIDAFIAKNEELIALLNERKRAILPRAMDELAGETIKLRYLYKPSKQANHPDEIVLSVYREHGVVDKSSRSDNFNVTPDNLDRYLFVRPDDVVVNRMKAWQGSLGVAPIRGIVSGDYEVLRPRGDALLPEYANHLLRSPKLVGQYGARSTGIRPSQWRLYWDQMGDIRVTVPARDVQARVAREIDERVDTVARGIRTAETVVSLARERRAALISAAVTGKIDVGVVA